MKSDGERVDGSDTRIVDRGRSEFMSGLGNFFGNVRQCRRMQGSARVGLDAERLPSNRMKARVEFSDNRESVLWLPAIWRRCSFTQGLGLSWTALTELENQRDLALHK